MLGLVFALVLTFPAAKADPPDTGFWEATFDTGGACAGDTGCFTTSSEELLSASTLHALQVFPSEFGDVVLCDGGYIDDADADWTVTPYTYDGVYTGRYHQVAAIGNGAYEWMLGVQVPFGVLEGSGYSPPAVGIPTDDYMWGIDLSSTGMASGVDSDGFVHVWGNDGAALDGALYNDSYIVTSDGRKTVCAAGRPDGGIDCVTLEAASSAIVTSPNRPTTGTCPRVGVGRYQAVGICDGDLYGWGNTTADSLAFYANLPTTGSWRNAVLGETGYAFAALWNQDNSVTLVAGSGGASVPGAITHAPGWATCRTSATARVYTPQYVSDGTCYPMKFRMMPTVNPYDVGHAWGAVVLEGGTTYERGTALVVGSDGLRTVEDSCATL